MASALEDIEGAVINPGWLFRITTTFSIAGGALLLAWLCEQITARGIGNGIALVLFTGIVADLLPALARLMEASRGGALSNGRLGIGLIAVIALTVLIAAAEQAQRRLAVDYSARSGATRSLPASSAMLVFKLNSAGLLAVIVAGWFSEQGLQHPVGYMVFLVVFSMVYTAFVLDLEEAAKGLQERYGTIPAVEPGEPTAAYLDFVLSRTALIGALYLAFVCLLPEMLVAYAEVPVYFAGTSLLIAVCTVLDLRQHFAAYTQFPAPPRAGTQADDRN
jgi:preprotein translocase subunit SecY